MAAASENVTLSYKVQSGDWLDRIARAVGVDAGRIKAANKQIPDFDKIEAGARLSIPVTLKQGHLYYHVQKGDTPRRIAAAFGLPVTRLMDANKLRKPDSIGIRTMLKIPVG